MFVTALSVAMFVFGGVGLVGSALSRTQRAEAELRVRAARERVWQRVAGDRTQPWRTDLARVEVVDARHWTEFPRHGPPLRFASVVERAPEHFEVRFEGGGVVGRWEGRLEEASGTTSLRCVEEIEIDNPFFRVLARLFGGPERAMRVYLDQLERSLS